MKTTVVAGIGFAGVGVVAALTALAGCAGQDPVAEEHIAQVGEELWLSGASYDPPSGFAPTQCTVTNPSTGETLTMHCCPDWQSGRRHMAMIGGNPASNVFKCARLATDFVSTLPVEMHNGTRVKDGVTFLACPSRYVMVGLHAALGRVACARAPGALVVEQVNGPPSATTDWSGMHVCPPANPNPSYFGYAMAGINLSQNKFLCVSN